LSAELTKDALLPTVFFLAILPTGKYWEVLLLESEIDETRGYSRAFANLVAQMETLNTLGTIVDKSYPGKKMMSIYIDLFLSSNIQVLYRFKKIRVPQWVCSIPVVCSLVLV